MTREASKDLTPCEGFQGQQCSNMVEGYVEERCCDGRECGCMGLPLTPCWCTECWAKWEVQRKANVAVLASGGMLNDD